MSRATKRKHVIKEVLLDDLMVPSEAQQVVRVVASRGNNLHEVETRQGSQFLVSMPTKFRKNVWIKRGDFVLVEPIAEGDKVKAEIVSILTPEHIRFFKSNNCWPVEFGKDHGGSVVADDVFVNTNRQVLAEDSSESDTSSEDESSTSDTSYDDKNT